jgi:hypothetical protein
VQLTKYGPKSRVSPTIGDPCPFCAISLAAGDYTTLVPKGGSSRFANDAVEAHWDCIGKRWPKGTGEGQPP